MRRPVRWDFIGAHAAQLISNLDLRPVQPNDHEPTHQRITMTRLVQRTLNLGSLVLVCLALTATATPASAGDVTWTNGAGGFSWTEGLANYWSPFGAWGNALVNSTFFNSTGAGTITLGSPITARALDFSANGYTINGSGANILTLASGTGSSLADGQIIVNPSFAAAINAAIAGTVGLTKTGTGTLELGANET
jgi:fibronectin-binding autotransporter adhesin